MRCSRGLHRTRSQHLTSCPQNKKYTLFFARFQLFRQNSKRLRVTTQPGFCSDPAKALSLLESTIIYCFFITFRKPSQHISRWGPSPRCTQSRETKNAVGVLASSPRLVRSTYRGIMGSPKALRALYNALSANYAYTMGLSSVTTQPVNERRRRSISISPGYAGGIRTILLCFERRRCSILIPYGFV